MSVRTIFLLSTALAIVAAPAFADDAAIMKRLDALQHMMELQQKQIAAQRGEITALKSALRRKGAKVAPVEAETAQAAPAPAVPSLVETHVAQQQVAIDDLVNKFAALE